MAQLPQINEFLCFLSVQFDKFARENLIATLLDTYVYSEAAEAKNILIGKCEELNISESIGDFTMKRVEGKRDALRRVVTDASMTPSEFGRLSIAS